MQTAVLVVYLCLILAVGIWSGRGIRGLKDYAVAGKSFGMLAIFATLSASFIGGGFSMGNAEKVFLVGISNIVALWGFSLKEVLVARFIAPRMENYPDAISVGDIMETHYGPSARLFSGIFGVMLCAGILGAQVGATGYIFNLFFGIDRIWGIFLGCGIIIIYATLGGMRSVVWTDIFQFIVLAVGIPYALYAGVQHVGGWDQMVQAIPAERLSIPTDPASLIALGSLFLTFVFGETLVPPYLQRLMIGRSGNAISRGTLLSGLFSVPFFAVTGCLGLVALAMNPQIDANMSMPFVIQEALPPFAQGIVIAAIVSIIMSSADSFLNAAAIAFTNDIVHPLRKERLSEVGELRLARWVTLIVGILSIVFAISIDSILDILIYAYTFWAPTVLLPLGAAILGCQVSKRRFVFGAVAGVLGMVIWGYILNSPAGIDGLIVGLAANAAAFFAVDRKAASEAADQITESA